MSYVFALSFPSIGLHKGSGNPTIVHRHRAGAPHRVARTELRPSGPRHASGSRGLLGGGHGQLLANLHPKRVEDRLRPFQAYTGIPRRLVALNLLFLHAEARRKLLLR